ncbi:MAG TPA: hypothetical protein VIU15_41225 [Streptomyces sp.]
MNRLTTPALIGAVAESEALVEAGAFWRLGRSARRGTALAGPLGVQSANETISAYPRNTSWWAES